MSLLPNALRSRGDEPADVLFEHQARSGGKVVAVLRGVPSEDGSVTVEAEVYTAGGSAEGIARPFPFASRAQAEHFADEAVRCLEYLGCEIVT